MTANDNRKRIVITGLGVVSPLGSTIDTFWEGMINGRNAIGPITLFDAGDFGVKLAAEVKDFDPCRYMDIKRVDRTGRCSQFAIAASKMALEHAGLDISLEDAQQVGVVIGTSGMPELLGEQAEIINRKGPNRVDPLVVSKYRASMVPSHVGLEVGAKGINTTVNSACSSGSDALGTALNLLRLGRADVMLAGGSGANVTPLAIAATGRIGALSREIDPHKASRPFDLNRSGFVYGEGAGMLVLETYEHAIERDACILTELAGAGWSFDAVSETAPAPGQRARAMQLAIQDAGITPGDISYVNAHGTGTRLNDTIETQAIKLVLGEHAYRIPVSSNKSMLGHLGCAAGSVEAIAAVLSILHGVAPPTINYQTPDPACDLDYVPNTARKAPIHACLSNSFGLGGQNCCLVITRFQP